MRRCAVLVLTLPLLLAGGALAGAASHPTRPTLAVDRPHVHRGGTVTLYGRGFPRRARIVLLAAAPRRRAKRIGAARTGVHGSFFAPIRIDRRAAHGIYVATACQDRCRVMASVRFRVLSRPAR